MREGEGEKGVLNTFRCPCHLVFEKNASALCFLEILFFLFFTMSFVRVRELCERDHVKALSLGEYLSC